MLVCFGEVPDDRFKRFARILFDWYRAPVIQVTFADENGRRARIKRVKLQPFTNLKGEDQKLFVDALTKYTGREWKSPKGSARGAATTTRTSARAVQVKARAAIKESAEKVREATHAVERAADQMVTTAAEQVERASAAVETAMSPDESARAA
jgi:hypothetical protein